MFALNAHASKTAQRVQSGHQDQMTLLLTESRQRAAHKIKLSQFLRLLCGIHFLTTLNQQRALHFGVT